MILFIYFYAKLFRYKLLIKLVDDNIGIFNYEKLKYGLLINSQKKLLIIFIIINIVILTVFPILFVYCVIIDK